MYSRRDGIRCLRLRLSPFSTLPFKPFSTKHSLHCPLRVISHIQNDSYLCSSRYQHHHLHYYSLHSKIFFSLSLARSFLLRSHISLTDSRRSKAKTRSIAQDQVDYIDIHRHTHNIVWTIINISKIRMSGRHLSLLADRPYWQEKGDSREKEEGE